MGERMRIVVVGSGGVGKSAITIQFLQGKFVKKYDPTIEDNYRKTIIIDDKSTFLDILDTAGQEEYSSMEDVYFKNGDGFVIVYSITNSQSFRKINEIRESLLMVKDKETFPMVIIGNKCDLDEEREVQESEATKFCEDIQVPFFETSALKNINIYQAFQELIRFVRKERELELLQKKKDKKCILM
ncbi:ras-like protein [Anaeramoeba flamelloides]|uniref:small monomeric GTPase n=1 Tax=Anaeramoeba flamelloides TaxID=1746091 RepID=A0AAV7YXA6_9EUKA|nr:ras-like protein [Anaeramoeba flamelloides]KAJ6254363.1 ras-like protein [Anaeramoeba flamelloides]